MPESIGEHDLSKEYPPEARRLGIEGQVAVRLLVDETGRVAQRRLVRGVGHGLDEKALELARRIRFRPALDDADRPVSTWITWTFTFTLPR
jgi:TonB family protein